MKILVLDFGSPTTQLIGRRVRNLGVFSEILPYYSIPKDFEGICGVILSGSPYLLDDKEAFRINFADFPEDLPLLAIGYSAELMASELGKGGIASASQEREACLQRIGKTDTPLLKGVAQGSELFMPRRTAIDALPENLKVLAQTESGEVVAFQVEEKKRWGVLFYPEAEEAPAQEVLSNFIEHCGAEKNWSPATFVERTIEEIRTQVGNDKVILGLSGGVDSSVCAVLLNRAIGENLTCIFVNHGLLRKGEFEDVQRKYQELGLNLRAIDASQRFYDRLAGVNDPEKKRKTIGEEFIKVFEEEASKIDGAKWLGQGTIYPDVIESISVTGTVIKSHHNVGGLPEEMKLQLVEPLRMLFKDEVRKVGLELGMERDMIFRHPFPGPGLGIRILEEITPAKVKTLQEADHIFISKLREWGLYDKIWQSAAILLPVRSVGKKGEERTYDNVIALRCVHSVDAMTAEWVDLPHDFLVEVSKEILHHVPGINRVVYDISSKPPATIEWE